MDTLAISLNIRPHDIDHEGDNIGWNLEAERTSRWIDASSENGYLHAKFGSWKELKKYD